jgi:DNA-binding CsgD family transcriptional regulator
MESTKQKVIELWWQLKDIDAVANHLSITPHTVRYHLRKASIDFKEAPLITKQQLELYIKQGLSFSQIGRNLGMSSSKGASYISALARRLGIKSIFKATSQKDLSDPIDIIYSRYIKGESLHKLSKSYGRPVAAIKKKLLKHYPRLVIRSQDDALRPAILNNKNLLAKEAKIKSYRQIAKELNVKLKTVTNAAKKFGLDFTSSKSWDLIDYDALFEMYVTMLLPPSEIAVRLGYPYQVVLRQLRKAGFVIARPGGRPRKSKYLELADDRWLRQQYIDNKRSMHELAGELGTTPRNIIYHLRKFSIPMRSKAEYLKLLLAKVHGTSHTFRDLKCDSMLEVDFLKSLNENSNVERNIELSYMSSTSIIDFRVDGELYEVKPKEIIKKTGCERRRAVKQLMLCKKNKLDVKFWTKAGLWDQKLEDDDIYYAVNWQLFFDSPEDCSRWLIDYGYKPPKYSHLELCDFAARMNYCKAGHELNANYNNGDPVKLTYHFFEHYWNCKHKGYNAITDIWEEGNRSVLKRAIEEMWGLNKEINIYGLLKYVKKHMRDFNSVSIFKPWVAGYIYDRYLPNGGTVIDPSCGWGGRFMAASARNIRYIGYDINQLAIKSHENLNEFLGSRVKVKPTFICADSSTHVFDSGDLIFTSPPYDDLELYHGVDSRATLTADILRNIFRHNVKIIALNIPKNMVSLCKEIASGKWELIESIEMKTEALYGARTKTFEPILVFKQSD